MHYKTAIIGLGTIAQYHAKAIRSSEQFDLCAVCDIRKESAQNILYQDLPFFTDYEELLDIIHPDVAVITTPPSSHYAIAKACISRHIIPFVEKPLAASQEEGELFFTPEMHGFVPVCHTLYGPEMLWLTHHMPLQQIQSIHMTLDDPYADENGQIDNRFLPLGGCWVTHARDKIHNLPYATTFTAQYLTTQISIDLAWNRHLNHKQTKIEADGKHIIINHSEQAVIIDGQEVFRAQTDRLTDQYTNFYRIYPERVPTIETQQQMYNIIYSNM